MAETNQLQSDEDPSSDLADPDEDEGEGEAPPGRPPGLALELEDPELDEDEEEAEPGPSARGWPASTATLSGMASSRAGRRFAADPVLFAAADFPAAPSFAAAFAFARPLLVVSSGAKP